MQNHSKEAVEFAGFWVRLAAYAIDMAIVTVGLLIVRLVFIGINSLIAGTFLEGGILFHYTLKDIVLYLLQVVYFILFTYHTGTTLGKKALNLRVICKESQEKLSLLTVVYRETIGRFLSGLILCIGYLIIGVDKEKRGLHDILCDTRVIYAKKVKVYPVYQGNRENIFVPQMVDDVAEEQKQEEELKYSDTDVEMQMEHKEISEQTLQEEISNQWNMILNKKNQDNIEGES